MTNEEMFDRNQELFAELDRYMLEHPEVADEIPEGALVVVLPAFDRALAKENRALARNMREPGQAVVYVRVSGKAASRLQGLRIEVASGGPSR